MDFIDSLRARWRDTWSADAELAHVRPHFDAALGVHISIRDKGKALQKDGRLTTIGRREDMAAFAAGEPTKALYQAMRAKAVATARVDKTFQALAPKVADRTDVAAASVRSSIRNFLADLDPLKRTGLLLDPAVDAEVVVAALEVPAVVLGIAPDVRQKVIDAYVDRQHPGIVATMAERREAIDTLGAAIEVGRRGMVEALEIRHEHGWNTWWAQASEPVAKTFGAIDEAVANTGPDFNSIFEMIMSLPDAARRVVFADFERIRANEAARAKAPEDATASALDALRGGPLGLALAPDERARLSA